MVDKEATVELLNAVIAGKSELIEGLVRRGANPNIALNDGRTALTISVSNKNIATTLALLKVGANPNVEYLGEARGITLMLSPLWIATDNVDIAHVTILLNNGASIYSDARYNAFFHAALDKDISPVHNQIYQLFMDRYFKDLERSRANAQAQFIESLHSSNSIKQYQELEQRAKLAQQCLEKNQNSTAADICGLKNILLPSNKRDVEYVIVRFDEDPEFLAKWISLEIPNKKITVYNKGKDDLILPPNCKIIKIPNKGWFGGTALYHIHTQYDNLAERLVVLQADPYPQSMVYPIARYEENLPTNCNSIIAKCTISSLAEQDAHFTPNIGKPFPPGKYVKFPPLNETIIEYTHKYYGKYPLDTPLAVNLGAQFAVDRAIVYGHPKEYYQAPAGQLNRNQYASEDFYQEKLIDLMFQQDISSIISKDKPATWSWGITTHVFSQEGLVESNEFYKWQKKTDYQLRHMDEFIQSEPKIPHITHTMWFSPSNKPKYMSEVSLKKCIKTAEMLNKVDPNYKHFFWTNNPIHVPPALIKAIPNLEIRLMDEFKDHELYDKYIDLVSQPITNIAAVVQASDFRYLPLYKYGGFYHDTDGELFDAEALVKYTYAFDFFGVRELKNNNMYIASATIGAVPDHPVVGEAIKLLGRNLRVEKQQESQIVIENMEETNNISIISSNNIAVLPEHIEGFNILNPIDGYNTNASLEILVEPLSLPNYLTNPEGPKTIRQSCETGPMMLSVAYAKANNMDGYNDIIFPRCALHNVEYAWYKTPGSRCSTNVQPSLDCEFNGIKLPIVFSDLNCGDWYGQM